jgi:hypothetical protein
MIWLRDLAVEVERAADGRTGRVIVSDNDALASGERPPIEGASVVVTLEPPTGDGDGDGGGEAEGEPRVVARGRTGPGGFFGFATPPNVATGDLVVSIEARSSASAETERDAGASAVADEFNPRRVRLDGTNLAVDLRRALYGARVAEK